MSNKMIVPVIFVLLVLVRCSSDGDRVGTSEQGNARVAARIRNSDGTPAAGATVRLRTADYLSPLPGFARRSVARTADTITDADGRFYISGLVAGNYRIEIRSDTSAALLDYELSAGEQADLGTQILRPFATITGTVEGAMTGYVQVYGLERIAAVDSRGVYTIADLPAATLRLRIVAADTGVQPVVIESVRTFPGEVTVAPLAGRRFSRRLTLNTTASGANVTGSVTGFPLLIRLAHPDFDFSEASDSGADLRFTGSNGALLPHLIEAWDPVAKRAVLWVRLDTVRGNDSTQYLTMHWGITKSPIGAQPLGNAVVFDTADGFAGVWQGSAPDAPATILDRTQRKAHGAALGNWLVQSRAEGIIGEAMVFNGLDNAIMIASGIPRAATSDITLSAWVQTTDTITQPVLSYQSGSSRFRVAMQVRTWFGILPGASPWLSSPNHAPYATPIVADGKWHLMTVVYERRGYARMYVDGIAADSLDISSAAAVDMAADTLVIGRDNFMSPGYYRGVIDEVRLETVGRSPAWIRLCYENQRRDQRLVKFR